MLRAAPLLLHMVTLDQSVSFPDLSRTAPPAPLTFCDVQTEASGRDDGDESPHLVRTFTYAHWAFRYASGAHQREPVITFSCDDNMPLILNAQGLSTPVLMLTLHSRVT